MAKYEEMMMRIGFVLVTNEKDFVVTTMTEPRVSKTSRESIPSKRTAQLTVNPGSSLLPKSSTKTISEAATAVVISQIKNVSLR